jgi:hypothetical protein
MKIALGVLTLACIWMTAGLAACGGGGDKKTEAATPPPAATTAPATTEETTGAASGGGGTTAPGTTVGLGETAHVTIKPLSEGFDSKVRYKLDATVLKIEKKSVKDLKNVNLDPEQKKTTPYWVSVRFANTDRKLPADEDPDVRLNGIDDRGQEQQNIIFLGGFPPCEDKNPPKPFSKGKSYESCLVFLIPGGGSLDAVTWTGADEYVSKPVTWK